MRAEINQGQLLNKFKNAKEYIVDVKKQALRNAVDHLVERSPIDTGVYIDNHQVAPGNATPSSPRTSSEGLRGYYDIYGRNYNRLDPSFPERAEARQRLWQDIEALPDDFKRASISNSAEHFNLVEYGWPRKAGYAPFTSMKSGWPQFKIDAEATARARYKK